MVKLVSHSAEGRKFKKDRARDAPQLFSNLVDIFAIARYPDPVDVRALTVVSVGRVYVRLPSEFGAPNIAAKVEAGSVWRLSPWLTHEVVRCHPGCLK